MPLFRADDPRVLVRHLHPGADHALPAQDIPALTASAAHQLALLRVHGAEQLPVVVAEPVTPIEPGRAGVLLDHSDRPEADSPLAAAARAPPRSAPSRPRPHGHPLPPPGTRSRRSARRAPRSARARPAATPHTRTGPPPAPPSRPAAASRPRRRATPGTVPGATPRRPGPSEPAIRRRRGRGGTRPSSARVARPARSRRPRPRRSESTHCSRPDDRSRGGPRCEGDHPPNVAVPSLGPL